MNFAIVTYADENDAPGIVSTNWLNKEKNKSFFPTVRTDQQMTKLLIARKEPEANWLEYKVKVLREFSTYEHAKGHLSKAEDTSNLESEEEIERPRKRAKKVIRLPGEKFSTTDEEEFSFQTPSLLYPLPPNSKTCNQAPTLTNECGSSQRIERANSESCHFPVALDLYTLPQCSSQSISNVPSSPVDLYTLPQCSSQSISNVPSSPGALVEIQSAVNEIKAGMLEVKKTQANLFSLVSECMVYMQRSEARLDMLIARAEEPRLAGSSNVDEEFNIISSLPVGAEGFLKLNNLISSSQPFRQRLRKVLSATGGRDAKSLTANLLRRIVVDDIGELFSLTGKTSQAGLVKQSFEKTETYKVILDICYRNYGVNQESVVREAISDWLMQAKYRKTRREKRMSVPAGSLLECEDGELS